MSKYLSLFEQDSEYRESSKTLPNVSNVIEDEVSRYFYTTSQIITT